jgi:hypothetical protein
LQHVIDVSENLKPKNIHDKSTVFRKDDLKTPTVLLCAFAALREYLSPSHNAAMPQLRSL